jgi:hypothetical protein
MLVVCLSLLSQNTAISTKCAGAVPSRCRHRCAEVDLFVEPTVGPLLAGVGNEVREAADVFVFPRFQPVAPDHLHGALLAAVCHKPKKQPRGVIVTFARALVERAADGQFDTPSATRASFYRPIPILKDTMVALATDRPSFYHTAAGRELSAVKTANTQA